MCDVDGEVCFSQKMFTNELNMGVSLRAWFEKIVQVVETYWLTGKEKSSGCSGQKRKSCWQCSKTLKDLSLLSPLEKCATVNITSYFQLLRQNSPHLLNDPHNWEEKYSTEKNQYIFKRKFLYMFNLEKKEKVIR